MALGALLWDNPILVKHARSRLRRQHLVPAVVGTVVVCACIVWGMLATGQGQNDAGMTMLLVVQGILLFIIGTAQVANSVAQAKDSGILDFHRISPLPALTLTLGFILGAPLREWVLYLVTLPFMLVCIVFDKPSLPGLLLLEASTVLVALLYHTLAVFGGMLSGKARGANNAIVGTVAFLNIIPGMFMAMGATNVLTIQPAAADALDWRWMSTSTPMFFVMPVGRTVLGWIHQAPLLFFLFVGGMRRMRNERAFFYSKPGAVAFFATIALVLLGDVVGMSATTGFSEPAMTIAIPVYGLTLAGVLLGLTVTPSFGDFVNGVRRYRKLQQPRLALWSDAAPNWGPVLAFCAILCGTAVAAAALQVNSRAGSARLFAAALVGACVVFYFNSARQAFELLYRKSGQAYLLLSLFVFWILPLLGGMLLFSPGLDSTRDAVLGVSPIASIGMITAAQPTSPGVAVAVGSSVLLAVWCGLLRLRAERYATRAALAGQD